MVDLIGKHSRGRTVPMPNWVKVAIDAWTSAAGVAEGQVFRPVSRADRVLGERLGEKVVWQLLRGYAETAGVPGSAPHDARRTCAKLCRVAGGELEQIQLLLGRASVQTTEPVLGNERGSRPSAQRRHQAEGTSVGLDRSVLQSGLGGASIKSTATTS